MGTFLYQQINEINSKQFFCSYIIYMDIQKEQIQREQIEESDDEVVITKVSKASKKNNNQKIDKTYIEKYCKKNGELFARIPKVMQDYKAENEEQFQKIHDQILSERQNQEPVKRQRKTKELPDVYAVDYSQQIQEFQQKLQQLEYQNSVLNEKIKNKSKKSEKLMEQKLDQRILSLQEQKEQRKKIKEEAKKQTIQQQVQPIQNTLQQLVQGQSQMMRQQQVQQITKSVDAKYQDYQNENKKYNY